jgi:hypothetical protein
VYFPVRPVTYADLIRYWFKRQRTGKELKMKIVCKIMLTWMLLTGAAHAADDLGLSVQTTQRVRLQAQEMVREGVDSEAAEAMLRSMIHHRFEERQILRAQEIVLAAHRNGLPETQVMLKAHEGMAKHVPADRIVEAMEMVRSRYATAFEIARTLGGGELQQHHVGKAIAEGLTAGMEVGAPETIARQIHRQGAQKSTQILDKTILESYLAARDMVRLGVSSQTSADMVCQALESGYDQTQMNHLRNRFRVQVQRTQSAPEVVARQWMQQFKQGGDPLTDAGEEPTQTRQRSRSGHDGSSDGVSGGNGSGSGHGSSGSGGASGGSGGGHSDQGSGSSGSGGSGGGSGSGGSSGGGGRGGRGK